jgi:hypothetical protein
LGKQVDLVAKIFEVDQAALRAMPSRLSRESSSSNADGWMVALPSGWVGCGYHPCTGASLLAGPRQEWKPSGAMGDTTRYERIGSALHALAADLAAERRRASALRRENEKLSAQLEALKEELATSVARSKAGLAASVS